MDLTGSGRTSVIPMRALELKIRGIRETSGGYFGRCLAVVLRVGSRCPELGRPITDSGHQRHRKRTAPPPEQTDILHDFSA